MDGLRALQLLTNIAYLLLGIAAVGGALAVRNRARVDMAILFGALAGAVSLQEIQQLVCAALASCGELPWSLQVETILVLLLPYALMRLVDDVVEVPTWQLVSWGGAFVILAALTLIASSPPPGPLLIALTVYLIVGTACAAWSFGSMAQATRGITRRRMALIAWGCALLAATLVLGSVPTSTPEGTMILMGLSRLAGLVSAVCFLAGFFPPVWLSQAWRLPELLGYLRPTRLMATGSDGRAVGSDVVAIDRLCTATASTTGAQRVFLVLSGPKGSDMYIWGAPLARIDASTPLFSRAMASPEPIVERHLDPSSLPPALVAAFGGDKMPRTAMLARVSLDDEGAGVLAAFADKEPLFVDDDVEVVGFFAAEAAAVLRVQRFRQSVSELEALREADRLKDEFMAVVSHELRTPLTAISGYSDILLRKLSGPLNQRQEHQVIGVRDAARRLLSLINDLLDVSKLEAGTLDLHLTALDASSAIARAVNSVRVIAASKGVTIEAREPTHPIPPVQADDERLQQILTNLIINAIKFTPQGGRVWVEAHAVDGVRGPEIAFRVQDTGVGLTPTQSVRIWERFYQAESTSTRRFGGAGLGLSIVRRLVELHGGHVDAHSAGVDRGSTFTAALPAAPATDAHAEPQVVAPFPFEPSESLSAAADAVHDSPVVLVVEDDPHIATVLRTYIEADGYQVALATDGEEALQLARTLRPFAITLDISLPKLDGWTVLNALKREEVTSEIPVIIVSIVDNRDFGMVLGATEYLVKPIDHERLRGVLRSLDRLRTGDGRGSILVVDDDPALRDVLGSVLEEDGWRVMTAADGAAALAAIDHERPTAMVLDLMMPRVDGFEVLRQVRAQTATRDLPVIVVTAKDLTEEDRERLAVWAERVVLKQASRVDELRDEIRGLLLAHRERGAVEDSARHG